MGQLLCPCGSFQSEDGALWAVSADQQKMEPTCPACGARIHAGAAERPPEILAQIAVVNLDRLSEPSLAAVLNVKAAIAAQFHWADDPDYRAWLAQPQRQYIRAADQSQFETIIAATPLDRRILIHDRSKRDEPLVLIWLLPMRPKDVPAAVNALPMF